MLAPLAVVAMLLAAPAPAHADPPPSNPDGAQPSGSLQDQLTAATRAYVDAKGRLDAAVAKQQQFRAELANAAVRLTELSDEVGVVAAASYRAGPLGTFAIMLDSTSSDDFVERASALRQLARSEDLELHDLNTLRDSAAQTQAQLDAAVNTAKVQTAELERRKAQITQASAGSPPARTVTTATGSPGTSSPTRAAWASCTSSGTTRSGSPAAAGTTTRATAHPRVTT